MVKGILACGKHLEKAPLGSSGRARGEKKKKPEPWSGYCQA